MKQIEQLSKLLPFGSIFIILCSSVKLVMFYEIFKIPIVEYISIGEYLTLFVDDILYYLAIFGFGLILYIINTDFTKENDNSKEIDYKTNSKKITFVCILIILISVSAFFLFKNSEINSQKYAIIELAAYAILIILYLLSTNINFNFTYPFFILITILIYSIIDGKIDAYKIIENAGKSEYNIELKDKKIVTNKKLVYIGKTEKYIYLYEIDTKTSIIIPNENIKQLKIK